MNFEEREKFTYIVVKNHEDQYSIWPDFKPIPAGWEDMQVRGSKTECLAHIKEVWTDMRPKSLRLWMEEHGYSTPPANSSSSSASPSE